MKYYSIEPRTKNYVKEYGFLSFARHLPKDKQALLVSCLWTFPDVYSTS